MNAAIPAATSSMVELSWTNLLKSNPAPVDPAALVFPGFTYPSCLAIATCSALRTCILVVELGTVWFALVDVAAPVAALVEYFGSPGPLHHPVGGSAP